MSKRKDKKIYSFFCKVDPLPFIYLLPAIIGIIYSAIRWGQEIKNVIQVFIKLVVKA